MGITIETDEDESQIEATGDVTIKISQSDSDGDADGPFDDISAAELVLFGTCLEVDAFAREVGGDTAVVTHAVVNRFTGGIGTEGYRAAVESDLFVVSDDSTYAGIFLFWPVAKQAFSDDNPVAKAKKVDDTDHYVPVDDEDLVTEVPDDELGKSISERLEIGR